MIDAAYGIQVVAYTMGWVTVGLAGRDYLERRETWQEYSRRESEQLGEAIAARARRRAQRDTR